MSKKKNKTKKEMLEDYDLYKEQTNDKFSYTYYTNYEYLSYKDRENFDNKFYQNIFPFSTSFSS